MKKKYQAPITQTIEIKCNLHLLTDSINLNGSYNGTDEIESRSSGYWVDDEEY